MTTAMLQEEDSESSAVHWPSRDSHKFSQPIGDRELELQCVLRARETDRIQRLLAEILAASIGDNSKPGELLEFRALLIQAAKQLEEQSRIFAELRSLALTDDLTGLYNRRGFLVLGLQTLKLARRAGQAALLFFLDVDHLKDINDRNGHAAGDECLLSCAQVLRDTFRDSDIIARFGGDEFAVLALETNGNDARAILKRIENAGRAENAKHPAWELSLSTGAARLEGNRPASMTELLVAADADMYRHKHRDLLERAWR
jgi:diguanylate cyclase (GGDEF)-like protein